MAQSEQVAVARFVMRGKENLVLIRAAQGGLMLHTMYFADEVRNFGEIDKGQSAKIKDNEIELALQLISGLASDDFKPENYQDEYRQRVHGHDRREGRRQGDHDRPRARRQDLPGHRPRRGAPSEPGQARARRGRDKKPLAKAKDASAARRAEAAPRKAQAGRK